MATTKRNRGITLHFMCDDAGKMSRVKAGFDAAFSTPGLWTLGWVTDMGAVHIRDRIEQAPALVNAAMDKLRAVNQQVWRIVGDDPHVDRTGINLAMMLEDRGCYADGFEVLARTKIGDCTNTGVSGYERIR